MKIALVSPYDSAYPGGVSAHVSHLAREFRRLGHEVHVLAPSSARPGDSRQDPQLRFGRPVPIPANGSVARIVLSLRPWWRVKRLLLAEQYDVIHLHEPLMPALPPTVLWHSHATNIGTFHAYHRSNLAYFYAWLLMVRPLLFKRLHGLVAVSNPARDFVAEYFPGEYRIIPNGVDYDRFAGEVEPFAEYRDGRLNVLFVGRFDKRKGLKFLLRAWPYVRRQFKNVRLIVVGEGRARKGYQKFVAGKGWDEVVFTGYVSDDDLVRYYRTCDVFCAPSTGQESFGIVLLEAMAAGKPIVASRIAGYDEVVSDGVDGLLVEPKSDAELATALVRLLADPTKRRQMGRAGQKKAIRFRWERIARELLTYYEEVIAARPLATSSNGAALRRVRRAAVDVANLLVR